jgi:hypothetical protein
MDGKKLSNLSGTMESTNEVTTILKSKFENESEKNVVKLLKLILAPRSELDAEYCMLLANTGLSTSANQATSFRLVAEENIACTPTKLNLIVEQQALLKVEQQALLYLHITATHWLASRDTRGNYNVGVGYSDS